MKDQVSYRDVLELFLPIVRSFDGADRWDQVPREVRKFRECVAEWGVDIDNIDWAAVDAIPADEFVQQEYASYAKTANQIKNDPRWAAQFGVINAIKVNLSGALGPIIGFVIVLWVSYLSALLDEPRSVWLWRDILGVIS